MKKSKFLFSLLMAAVTYLTANAQVATARQSYASFGRNGSDCSIGRGVCAFNAQQAVVTSTTTKSAQKASANTFILKIKRTDLTTQDEIRIAGKAFSEIDPEERISFQQLDPIMLDNATLGNLDISTTLNKIAAGTYPMLIFSDRIEVTFTIEASK